MTCISGSNKWIQNLSVTAAAENTKKCLALLKDNQLITLGPSSYEFYTYRVNNLEINNIYRIKHKSYVYINTVALYVRYLSLPAFAVHMVGL